jgi:hypothetical protein
MIEGAVASIVADAETAVRYAYSEAMVLTARSASARSGTVVSSPNP